MALPSPDEVRIFRNYSKFFIVLDIIPALKTTGQPFVALAEL